MTLGNRIQQIRTEHGLSQEEFGEKLGTTRQTVSRWELDQSLPELAKIVLISRIFSVTTDSLLKDGITTFDSYAADFICGVYRSANSEIVETEKFALEFYCTNDENILGAKLYSGFEAKKSLVAVCERDQSENRTDFAYYLSDGASVISNNERLSDKLGSKFNRLTVKPMKRLEAFIVDHSGRPLPKVKEAGLPRCLTLWRMADSFHVSADWFNFFLCTGRTEYIFSIRPSNTDIYCGASYNTVFDLGLYGGGQFFRIRSYKDNSERFCRFYSDFSYEYSEPEIPTDKIEFGKCILDSSRYMWCLKRYTDDEIVLQGCGDDEYKYSRSDRRCERFASV